MATDPTGAINNTVPATAAPQTFPPEQISEFDRHLRHAAAPTDTSQLLQYASNDQGPAQTRTEGACTVKGANRLERRRELIEQYGGEANLQAHRRELQEQYDSVRDDPHQGKYALALRGQMEVIDRTLDANSSSARSGLSPSEQGYLAAEEENRLRTTNNLAMAFGGPVFTGAGGVGRAMGASERQVSTLIEANVEVMGTATMVKALKPGRTKQHTVASDKTTEINGPKGGNSASQPKTEAKEPSPTPPMVTAKVVSERGKTTKIPPEDPIKGTHSSTEHPSDNRTWSHRIGEAERIAKRKAPEAPPRTKTGAYVRMVFELLKIWGNM